MALHRSHGETEKALEIARRVRFNLEDHEQSNLTTADRALLYLRLGMIEMENGRVAHALHDLAHAARTPHLGVGLYASAAAAVLNAWLGRTGEADRLVQKIAATRDDDYPEHAQIIDMSELSRSFILIDQLCPEADSITRTTATDSRLWPFHFAAQARIYMSRGKWGSALDLAAAARSVHDVRPGTFADKVLITARTISLTHLGNEQIAAQELCDAQGTQPPGLRYAQALSAFFTEDVTKAFPLLRSIISDEEAGPLMRAKAHLLFIWGEHNSGREPDARHISAAKEIIHQSNLRSALTTVPQHIATLVDADPPESAVLAEPAPRIHLRSSEVRTLAELASEGTVEEIAIRMRLSVNTVKSHVKAIYNALDVHTRTGAVAIARQKGLID